jgi:hypothetical protein
MKKVVARDPAGNLYRYELPANATVQDVEKLFRAASHLHMPHGALVTDPAHNRILEKTQRIGELEEDIRGEVAFLLLPDTVNASV